MTSQHGAAADPNLAARQRPDAPLGTLIFRAGLVPADQLEDALEEGIKRGRRLGEILIERGLIKETDLARILAGQKGLAYVDPTEKDPDPEALALLSEEKAKLYRALPIGFENGVPLVAITDPSNETIISELVEALGREPRFAVAARSELVEAISRAYGSGVGDAAAQPGSLRLAASPLESGAAVEAAQTDGFEPAAESEVEPVAQPHTGPVPPTEPEAIVQPQDQPFAQPEPEPATDSRPELEPEPFGQPGRQDARPQLEPEPFRQPEPETVADARPELEPDAGEPIIAPNLSRDVDRAEPRPDSFLPAPGLPTETLQQEVAQPVAAVEPLPAFSVQAAEPAQVAEASDDQAQPPAPADSEHVPTPPGGQAPAFGFGPSAPEEPAATQPVDARPPEPEPEPEPEAVESAAVTPEPVLVAPFSAHQPTSESPAPVPPPVPAIEPTQKPAVADQFEAPKPETSFQLVLQLVNGERIEVSRAGSRDAALDAARSFARELARNEPGDWPVVADRLLRPEAIVTIDVAPIS
jgi:hypothetical protein